MSCISLVASAWKSTSRTRTSVGSSESTRSAARQGLSIGFMNSRPNTQRMPTWVPSRAVTTAQLRPTDSGGQVGRLDDV